MLVDLYLWMLMVEYDVSDIPAIAGTFSLSYARFYLT